MLLMKMSKNQEKLFLMILLHNRFLQSCLTKKSLNTSILCNHLSAITIKTRWVVKDLLKNWKQKIQLDTCLNILENK